MGDWAFNRIAEVEAERDAAYAVIRELGSEIESLRATVAALQAKRDEAIKDRDAVRVEAGRIWSCELCNGSGRYFDPLSVNGRGEVAPQWVLCPACEAPRIARLAAAPSTPPTKGGHKRVHDPHCGVKSSEPCTCVAPSTPPSDDDQPEGRA